MQANVSHMGYMQAMGYTQANVPHRAYIYSVFSYIHIVSV